LLPLLMEEFWTVPSMEPAVIAETSSYLVLYKPPRMHTAPLRTGENGTLLAWIALRFPEVLRINGRKDIEGGLIHRLDYETHGLVLCARTEAAFQTLALEQESGNIIKEYDACCHTDCKQNQPGFSPLSGELNLIQNGTVIESAFRPFGIERNAVRPVLNENTHRKTSALYRTEIFSYTETDKKGYLKIRIKKGFRHQIRCHLAWVGLPIQNDSLYGNGGKGGFLALRASAITFYENGQTQCFRISAAR
jgi:23S rRNA pseudouridine1911/1915/1917 synthase